MNNGQRQRVAIVSPDLAVGGGTRAALHIAIGLAGLNYAVDLLLLKSGGELEEECPETIRIVRATHSSSCAVFSRVLAWLTGVHYAGDLAASVPSLVKYINCERPTVLLGVGASTPLVLARRLARHPCRVAISAQVALTPIFRRQGRLRGGVQRTLTAFVLREVDRIIAVSKGVAQDMELIRPSCASKIVTIFNPTVTAALYRKANELLADPWLDESHAPIVVSVGLLKAQKDFPTLINAFARVRAKRPARLLILGEGYQRPLLERMIADLNLAESIRLAGYQSNPHNYVKRASLFVLASLYEGCPLALVEAMAVGTPVVSTDCVAGPAEILQHGRYGTLVPVSDPDAMAEAILGALAAPPQRQELQERARDFCIEALLPQFVDALGLNTERSVDDLA
jgi:glycosyltransferase involved in cell wall biosynthesis